MLPNTTEPSAEQSDNKTVNLQMLSMLNSDLKQMLDKYILDTFLLKFTSTSGINELLTNQICPDLNSVSLSLNSLALQRRKNLIAPIPVYPSYPELEPKSVSRDRTESVSTAKDEVILKTPKKAKTSPKAVENFSTPTKRKSVKKSKDKLKLIRMNLAFDNEGGDLSTRCDVVYKTILRDFRRFFLDGFKAFSNSVQEKHGIEDTLFRFVIQLLPNYSVNQCKTISLDLGCLLFPKELAKEKHVVAEMERRKHFNCKSNQIEDQIFRIHGFLYKFSIDKIEECFQNNSLCQLFEFYVNQTGDERISSNVTMSKNASIYLKARQILMNKVASKLNRRS